MSTWHSPKYCHRPTIREIAQLVLHFLRYGIMRSESGGIHSAKMAANDSGEDPELDPVIYGPRY